MSQHVADRTVPAVEPGRELKIVSHSNLFYWWPVWAVCFVMGLLTYWGDHRMAIVPSGTVAAPQRKVDGFEGSRDVLVAPEAERLPAGKDGEPTQPNVLMATSKNLGGFFLLVLLLVILATNVPLRGLWSAALILTLIAVSLFLALMDWWDPLLRTFGLIQVYMNAAGYFLIGGCLLFVWAVTVLVFDRRVYMIFSPGQFRVHLEIGEGETAYDAAGMVIHKRRDDLFRHWIIGMGSGDLVVTTGGARPQVFEVPNVLFVGSKITLIEQMLQEREVIHGQMGTPTPLAS